MTKRKPKPTPIDPRKFEFQSAKIRNQEKEINDLAIQIEKMADQIADLKAAKAALMKTIVAIAHRSAA